MNVKYGSWTVIGQALPGNDRHRRLLCRCDCGNIKAVNFRYLKNNKSTQCKSCANAKNSLHVKPGYGPLNGNFRHGKTRTIEYQLLSGMIQRCMNPKRHKYSNYGGRGIKVCDRWLDSFEAFLADVGQRPSHDLTLDRIDNDGNYEPGNVRWATAKQQAETRRKRKELNKRDLITGR